MAELWAEAIRAYKQDPNYMKTVAPNAAALIREHWNSNPTLRRILHFNSVGAGAGLGSYQSAEDTSE